MSNHILDLTFNHFDDDLIINYLDIHMLNPQIDDSCVKVVIITTIFQVLPNALD